MVAKVGRKLIIKKNNIAIAAIRAKTIAWNGEPIDISSDDDVGFRTILSDAEGQEQIDISGDGVAVSKILRDIALAPGTSKFLTDITIEWADTLEKIEGDFKLTSYEESGPYNEAQTFTFAMQSSGQWAYTPAA